jgi:hypothetical protein
MIPNNWLLASALVLFLLCMPLSVFSTRLIVYSSGFNGQGNWRTGQDIFATCNSKNPAEGSYRCTAKFPLICYGSHHASNWPSSYGFAPTTNVYGDKAPYVGLSQFGTLMTQGFASVPYGRVVGFASPTSTFWWGCNTAGNNDYDCSDWTSNAAPSPAYTSAPLSGDGVTNTAHKCSASFPVLCACVDNPTAAPSQSPSQSPSLSPSHAPSKAPKRPSRAPSKAPKRPSRAPSKAPKRPSRAPSKSPARPTRAPTRIPTSPSVNPTVSPTTSPQCEYTYSSDTNPVAIPDHGYIRGSEMVNSMATKSAIISHDGAIIKIVNVQVAINHTRAGDLVVKFYMDGKRITLTTTPGSRAIGVNGATSDLQSAYPINFVQDAPTSSMDMGLNLNTNQVICKDSICTYAISSNVYGYPQYSELAGNFSLYQGLTPSSMIPASLVAVEVGDWSYSEIGKLIKFSVTIQQHCLTTSPTTKSPTYMPTSKSPTGKPTTKSPTVKPSTKSPSNRPTTTSPSNHPSNRPSNHPTITQSPSQHPIISPSTSPTSTTTTTSPSNHPVELVPGTDSPSGVPTLSPS